MKYSPFGQQLSSFMHSLKLYTTTVKRFISVQVPNVYLAQPKKEVILFQPNPTVTLSTPIWNNIPEHMKSAKTVNTFKSMLKKHLFYTN